MGGRICAGASGVVGCVGERDAGILPGGKYGRNGAMQEMERKPKLEMLKRIVNLREWLECARVWRRWDRRQDETKRIEAQQVLKSRREGGEVPVWQERREYANYDIVIVVKWKMWGIG